LGALFFFLLAFLGAAFFAGFRRGLAVFLPPRAFGFFDAFFAIRGFNLFSISSF
jgi:hypothetical protein